DLANFRKAAEEMQFYSVIYDNSADPEPLYGPENALARGRAAVTALKNWGGDLSQLPMDDEKAAAKRELHDLLLKLSQSMLGRDSRPETAREVLKLLDRAATLQAAPTSGYFRLRGEAHRALGELAQASDDQNKAARQTPVALDHYL